MKLKKEAEAHKQGGLPPGTHSECSGNRKERRNRAPHKEGRESEALNLEKTKKKICLKRLKEK